LDAGQTYLVAWDGDTPIGHAHIAWNGTALGVPEIQDVFVLPERRRERVATELMHAVERHARERGQTRISLSYGIANTAARRLYERLGYRDAGMEPRHVHGTITIRGKPVVIDDTLVDLVKDL
jgi:GNAT superfamily N-acetyltransferase